MVPKVIIQIKLEADQVALLELVASPLGLELGKMAIKWLML